MAKFDYRINAGHLGPALMAVLGIGTVLLTSPADAKEKPRPTPQRPAEERTYTPEESARIGADVQRQDEARQRAWDRQMKGLTGSVCTGC